MEHRATFDTTVRGDLVTVTGELHVDAVPELERAVADATGPRRLDLSGVTFTDSSGLHAIIRLCDCDFTELVAVSPKVRRIFAIVGPRTAGRWAATIRPGAWLWWIDGECGALRGDESLSRRLN